MHRTQPLPYSGGYTRVPPVVLGPLGGTGKPRGIARYAQECRFHTPADTPESLQSCLCGLGDRDALRENDVYTAPSPTRQAAETPKSLRSCRDRVGDGDASCENTICIGSSHSRTPADASESLWSSSGQSTDRDAPWENHVCTRSSHSRTAADTPQSPQSCLGRLGTRDATWENLSSAVLELWFCSSGGVCVCVRVCSEPLYL